MVFWYDIKRLILYFISALMASKYRKMTKNDLRALTFHEISGGSWYHRKLLYAEKTFETVRSKTGSWDFSTK